eukprot:UN33460
MKPWVKCEKQVFELAELYATKEDLAKDEDFMKYDGTILQYALHRYAFYKCYHCGDPYFGGLKDCARDIEDDKIDRSNMLCSKCAKPTESFNKCKVHDDKYLLWKCKYCALGHGVWF